MAEKSTYFKVDNIIYSMAKKFTYISWFLCVLYEQHEETIECAGCVYFVNRIFATMIPHSDYSHFFQKKYNIAN